MASTLEKLIKEQVEADNLPMVEALLNSIVPLLPEGEKEKLGDSLIYNVLLDGKPAMVNTFAHQFPVTDAMAAGYLLDRSLFVHKNREAMPIALTALQESFGNVLISAIFKGDLEMVHTLQVNYPNRHIELSYAADNGRLLADGKEVKHQFEAMQDFDGVPAFRELMETLLKIVDANSLDQDEFLYDYCTRATLDDADKLTDMKSFTGELPSIQAGRVDHPELLLAFIEAQESVLLKSMHSRLFCWVKTEEVDDLPTGVTYSPVKKAFCYTEPFDFDILSTPAALTQDMLFVKTNEDRKAQPIMDQWPDVQIGVGLSGPEPSKPIIYSDKIRQKILLDSHFIGLNHPSGFTLMSLDIDVLKTLNIGKVDPDAVARAREYAQGFYTAQLLSPRYEVERDNTTQFRKEVRGKSLPSFFEYAANCQDKDAIFNSFDPTFWRNVFHAFSVALYAKGILEARDRFGLTNLDGRQGFSLTPDLVGKLFDGGYVFQNDASNCRMTYNTSTPAECAVADYKLMKMQGWPGRDTRPASVAEAMKIAIRKKETSHHSTFIQASGAEAAIQACKTEAQYRFILKLFSTDEIRPFAQQLPLKQLGDVFSMDIGL